MYLHLQALADSLDRFAEKTGRIIAWLTLAMVLTTVSIVVLRYLFNSGSIALQESVTYLHATVFMLGAAYTLKHDAHVRVDIVYQKLTPRARAWVDLLGTLLLLLPVCLFMLYSSMGYVEVPRWFRVGFLLSLVHLAVWLTLGLGWWKVLGWW